MPDLAATGRVTFSIVDDETSDPIAGAEVGMFVTQSGKADNVGLLHGTSAADGTCTIEAPVEGDGPAGLMPVARASGYWEWRKTWEEMRKTWDEDRRPELPKIARGETRHFDMRLEKGRTIAGRIVDEAGQPVVGAKLGLVLSGPNWCSWPYAFGMGGDTHWPPDCVSDADGRYAWLSFPAKEHDGPTREARWVLSAEHSDLEPAMAHDIGRLAPDEHGVVRIDFTLAAGMELSGSVLGPEGQALGGTKVTISAEVRPDQPECVRFEKEAVTDGAGTFSFRGLQACGHCIDVAAEGFAPASVKVDMSSAKPAAPTIRLRPGSVLSGTLLDVDGKPMPGEWLGALTTDPFMRHETTTDAGGGFCFNGLPAKGELTLRGPDHLKQTVTFPSDPITIQLDGEVALRVILTAAEDGSPLKPPGCVFFFGPGFSSGVAFGDDGITKERDVPAGHYEFYADVKGRAVTRAELDIPASGLDEPFEIKVPKGSVINGCVRDDGGAPLPGVRVFAWGRGHYDKRESVSAEDGSYELAGLNDKYLVAFVCEDYAVRAVWKVKTTLSLSPVTLDVTMLRGATVRGRVSSKDGKPLAGVLVKASETERPVIPYELPSAVTDASGAYELRHVPEGKHVVSAGTEKKKVKTRSGREYVVDF